MTTDEPFEHITAGLAEERRKDREEYRQLWRDTQRQINDLTLKVADTSDAVARLAEETRQNIDHLAATTAAADQALRDRIEGLVPAIGQFIASQHPRP